MSRRVEGRADRPRGCLVAPFRRDGTPSVYAAPRWCYSPFVVWRVVAAALLVFFLMGCLDEKDKCHKVCSVDSQTAKAGCEVANDPGACKEKVEDTKRSCLEACDAAE